MVKMVRPSEMTKLLSALTLALMCLGGAWMNAYAAEKNPCAEEIARFCKDVKPGEGRLTRCLNAHVEEASAACRKKMADVKRIVDEAQQACAGDVQKFCKGLQPGGGRLAKCMREHKAELSPACRKKLEVPKGTGREKKSPAQ